MSAPTPNVLVLGGSGLLGSALVSHLSRISVPVHFPSRDELDVLDFKALGHYVSGLEPDIIFNCVGYTQVDRAESELELALSYNCALPKALGKAVKGRKAFLVHYSTDFVFNGQKKYPYLPDDRPDPISAYGESKLAGEEELKKLDLENCAILRTAWLFGPGRRNFVGTILGICSREGRASVVHDQVGSPTFTEDLAKWSYSFALKRKGGIYHAVNSGEASWCELAAEASRLLFDECVINPITTGSLNLPARRPSYSVLDNSSFASVIGEKPRLWIDALQEYLLRDEISSLYSENS